MYDRPDVLAHDWDREIEPWMLWDKWKFIGCAKCQITGPSAECWGVAGCHGYKDGCGCVDCFAVEARKTEEVFSKSLNFLDMEDSHE